jgi:hypothetical protein
MFFSNAYPYRVLFKARPHASGCADSVECRPLAAAWIALAWHHRLLPFSYMSEETAVNEATIFLEKSAFFRAIHAARFPRGQ